MCSLCSLHSLQLLDVCSLDRIRTVESRQFQSFESFPTSQKVTYKFYEGRLAVFDENYEEAEAALTYALTHCHASAKKNIALILKYLVPVGLLLGRLPSRSLVQEYRGVLAPYLPIAEAVRSGNVGAFYSAMQEQRNRLVKDGTLLLLEKLQASVYRRLLKQVYLVHAQLEPAKAAQIPLVMYERALKVAGMDLDMSEIECIVANLIVRKYVKGYISHKVRLLLLVLYAASRLCLPTHSLARRPTLTRHSLGFLLLASKAESARRAQDPGVPRTGHGRVGGLSGNVPHVVNSKVGQLESPNSPR